MTAKTGEVATQGRPGGARGVTDTVYGYLAALFVLGSWSRCTWRAPGGRLGRPGPGPAHRFM
jgi:hypothetical protein